MGDGGMELEFGIIRGKLSYIEWINDKVQLYSKGNSIQYPVMRHNGKEYMYNWITLPYSRNWHNIEISYTSIKKKKTPKNVIFGREKRFYQRKEMGVGH